MLNHLKIIRNMNKQKMRPIDLARRLGFSRQLTNYILYHGGMKHAEKLAKALGCTKKSLMT